MLTKFPISRAVRAVFGAALLFLACISAFAQDAAKPGPTVVEDVYLAKDDGSGKAGDVVTEFGTGDIPIHCVVMLGNAAKVTVKMNFVAVAVAGVKPDTKVVTASYTTTERQNRVNFTGHPDGKWTPGRYRVDIFVNGEPQKQLEFNINGTPSVDAPAAAKFVEAAKPKPKPKN